MEENKEPPSTIKAVMNTPVVTTDPSSTVRHAAEIMSEKHIGCIVVTEKEKLLGMLTERDVVEKVVAVGLDPSKAEVKKIMAQPLVTVDEGSSIIEAIRIMRKNNIRRLPVLRNGKLVGIVTERDLLRAMALHALISFRPIL